MLDLVQVKCRDVNALVERALEARGKTKDDIVVKKVGVDGGGGYVKVMSIFHDRNEFTVFGHLRVSSREGVSCNFTTFDLEGLRL